MGAGVGLYGMKNNPDTAVSFLKPQSWERNMSTWEATVHILEGVHPSVSLPLEHILCAIRKQQTVWAGVIQEGRWQRNGWSDLP